MDTASFHSHIFQLQCVPDATALLKANVDVSLVSFSVVPIATANT